MSSSTHSHKAMTLAESNPTSATIAQGSVSVLAVAFLHDTFTLMFPFIFVAFVLILADLFFGIAAARKRKEQVRLSRAIRRTVNKIVEYACWIILAASLAVAFKTPALNWIFLALVIGNEMISIITNWLFVRGMKVSGLPEAFVKWLGKKASFDTSDIKIEKDEE